MLFLTLNIFGELGIEVRCEEKKRVAHIGN